MSHRERTLIAFLVIVGSIMAVYANTFSASWHFDDNTSIIQNPRIHLQEISISNLKEVMYPTIQGMQTDRPIAHLSFAFNWYFSQQDVFSYHLFNILIHIVSSFLIFLIIVKCYETKGLEDTHRESVFAIALLSSLFWALNPIQTQAITYIVQRMASMAALFYLFGIWCYLNGRLKEGGGGYFYFIASFSFYLLALGTKQNTIVFPAALLLLELFFLRENWLLLRAGTFFILFSIIAVAFIAYFVLDYRYDLNGAAFSNRSFDLVDRVLTEPRVIMMYLSQVFYPLPWRFSIIHDISISSSLVSPVSTIFSIVAIVCMGVFSIVNRYRTPILAFAILFYFLNHVVESTVMNLELMFEHRNYLPTAFLFWPISSLVVGAVYQRWEKARLPACGILVLLSLAVVSSGLWTYQRNRLWVTEELLWGDALKKSPAQARPYLALAASAKEKGQDELALMLYMESLKRKDPSPDIAKFLAFHNMAHIYFMRGELQNAERYYRRALEQEPKNEQALYNLAHTFILSGRYDEAGILLDEIMKEAGVNRNENFLAMKGFVLLRKGFADEAGHYFRSAYFAGNLNRKHLVARACSYIKSNQHVKASTLLTTLLEENETLLDTKLTLLFMLLENDLRVGNMSTAEKTAMILLSQYSIDSLGEKIIIGNDDLPLDTGLIKGFLRKTAQVFVSDFQQLHE